MPVWVMRYQVPVLVHVDTDLREVTRVVVIDEEVVPDAAAPDYVSDADGSIASPQERSAAEQIAGDTGLLWPRREFGY